MYKKGVISEYSNFEVAHLVKAGLYKSKAEVIDDAIRHLLLSHPNYKIEVAISAFTDGKISLGKAAEIAGLCFEEMKELLMHRGISLKLGPQSKEDVYKELEVADKLSNA